MIPANSNFDQEDRTVSKTTNNEDFLLRSKQIKRWADIMQAPFRLTHMGIVAIEHLQENLCVRFQDSEPKTQLEPIISPKSK